MTVVSSKRRGEQPTVFSLQSKEVGEFCFQGEIRSDCCTLVIV